MRVERIITEILQIERETDTQSRVSTKSIGNFVSFSSEGNNNREIKRERTDMRTKFNALPEISAVWCMWEVNEDFNGRTILNIFQSFLKC